MNEQLMTAREVADMLQVDPRWVLERVRRGELAAFRFGASGARLRFAPADVDAFLAKSKVGA